MKVRNTRKTSQNTTKFNNKKYVCHMMESSNNTVKTNQNTMEFKQQNKFTTQQKQTNMQFNLKQANISSQHNRI